MAYLTVVEPITIHAAVIQRYGGALGVRDMGALDAAAFRPRSGHYDGPIAEAAALAESILMNHLFVDGNKRVAMAAMDVHLRLNGWSIRADAAEAAKFLTDGLSQSSLDNSTLQAWLEEVVRPLPEVRPTLD